MSHRIVPLEPTTKMCCRGAYSGGPTPKGIYMEMLRAAPPYVITDADVERAAEAAYQSLDSDPRFIGRPPFKDSSAREMYLHQQRAALEAFVKGLENV